MSTPSIPGPLQLAVVVPTFKERANVQPLLELLKKALDGIVYEVIFVDDDSPDGTAALIRELGRTDLSVRVLQRVGRRGLSSACLEGMMATSAPCIAVMDADLQHDERILPKMLEKLRSEQLDVVIGTRNAEGGSMGEFSQTRVQLSQFGRRLSNWVTKTDISDPMSGFFMVSRQWLESTIHLTSAVGFKVLLDLVASSPRPVRVGEVPYTFRTRQFGESKLDIMVGLEYLQLLLDKSVGSIIPVRFILFCMVGTLGVVLSLSSFYVLNRILGVEFDTSLLSVTLAIMVVNFFVNNSITYRDRRLKGRGMWWGLMTFLVACSAGAYFNLRITQSTQQSGFPWYLALTLGLVAASVWNFGITSIFTWRLGQRALSRRTERVLTTAPQNVTNP